MKFSLVIACLAVIANSPTSYGKFYQQPLPLSPNYPTLQESLPENTVQPSMLGNVFRFKSRIREKWANAADNVKHELKNIFGFKRPHSTPSQTYTKPQPGYYDQLNSYPTSHYPPQDTPVVPIVLLHPQYQGVNFGPANAIVGIPLGNVIGGNVYHPVPGNDGSYYNPGSTNGASPGQGNATDAGPVQGNVTALGPSAGNATDIGPCQGHAADAGPVQGNATDVGSGQGNATDAVPVQGNVTAVGPSPGNATDVGPCQGHATNAGSVQGNVTDVGSGQGNATNAGSVQGNVTAVGSSPGNATDAGPVQGNVTDVGSDQGNTTNAGPVQGNVTDVGPSQGNVTDVDPGRGNATDRSPRNVVYSRSVPLDYSDKALLREREA